jgi:hypothetical protein
MWTTYSPSDEPARFVCSSMMHEVLPGFVGDEG